MTEKIEVFYYVEETAEALAQRTARYLVDRVGKAVAARGRARVAISGGGTPKRTFELLAKTPYREQMPWEKLDLYWVDERVVPPTDADSNYRMTREALLDKAPLPEAQIFRIHGELDPKEAAARYEFEIRRNFRLEGAEMPVFDVIALGMGPDGHTASLFPQTPALDEIERIAIANHVLTQKDAWRVTLTWPVINQARDVFFLIAGADKATPLQGVLLGVYNPHELPAQLIRPKSGRLTLLLDRAAASLLPKPDADGAGRLDIAR
jgi:6-phosphogluconolactonase